VLAFAPDVIVAAAFPSVAAIQALNRSVPIVFKLAPLMPLEMQSPPDEPAGSEPTLGYRARRPSAFAPWRSEESAGS